MSLPRLNTIGRITLSLVCLTISTTLVARLIGIIPDAARGALEARKALCETIAIDYSLAIQQEDLRTIRTGLRAIVARNPEMRSAALRRADGKIMVEVGHHAACWAQRAGEGSTATHVLIPIYSGSDPWGALEICFTEPVGTILGVFAVSDVALVLFIAVAGAAVYYFYLRKVLDHLNPASVVPERVRTTLNTLAEGVVVLDTRERVILGNDAFGKTIGIDPEQLQGRTLAAFPWRGETEGFETAYPWAQAVRTGTAQNGVVVKLAGEDGGLRTFRVNASPIFAGRDACQGALVSFEDVTLLEQRNTTLAEALKQLKVSRDQIRQQNEKLTVLATRDPLTLCYNRRALFEQFEKQLNACREAGEPLACTLLDVDHFKSVNDQHGHATGDHVLQMVAEVMTSVTGDRGIVGRYGGEEFCIVFPKAGMDLAAGIAEEIRMAIQGRECDGIHVTVSMGVSATGEENCRQEILLEEADKALYAAKHGGRNRVVRWHPGLADAEGTQSSSSAKQKDLQSAESSIPFRAVAVLVSALHYRHPPTAEHCRRVADLCVAAAGGLMSDSQRHVLEAAALLHDIGKLSVPDSILLKPDRLTAEEMTALRTHQRIGVQILESAFAAPALSEIVRHHHAWFAPTEGDPANPRGKAIPLGSRILFVAEAYDSMVTDQVHRPARTPEEAFAELRRWAGSQFDPELVERIIETVQSGSRCGSGESGESSNRVALSIGVQLEKLAAALETDDAATLAFMAGGLQRTAREFGLENLAEAAARLENIAAGGNRVEVVKAGAGLIDLCQSVQHATRS